MNVSYKYENQFEYILYQIQREFIPKIIYGSFSCLYNYNAVNVAHADIYKYVDKEGVLHLTNMPSDHNAKYVMIMKEKRILFQRQH